MWELYTGAVAFGAMHYGEVFERVVLHGDRPPIPDGIPEAYSLLMTSCWSSDPTARPSFESVLRCLQIMLQEHLQQRAADAAAGADGGSSASQMHSGAGGSGGDAAQQQAAALVSGGVRSVDSLSNSAYVQDLF